ncbi:hypothetical protein [Azospirillum sp. sgz301742]
MSVQSMEAVCRADTPAEEAEATGRRFDHPFIVFPALVLLLIMPLAIVFHPVWLPTIAEVGVAIMFIAIFRMSRM